MCIICKDFEAQKMSRKEARAALSEMREALPKEHIKEVEELIQKDEQEASIDP